jgi:hypothetical protein
MLMVEIHWYDKQGRIGKCANTLPYNDSEQVKDARYIVDAFNSYVSNIHYYLVEFVA